METELHICCIHAGGQGPAPVCSLVGRSVSERPQASRLVDLVGLPVEFLPTSDLSCRALMVKDVFNPAEI